MTGELEFSGLGTYLGGHVIETVVTETLYAQLPDALLLVYPLISMKITNMLQPHILPLTSHN